jgi:hypothetical protein
MIRLYRKLITIVGFRVFLFQAGLDVMRMFLKIGEGTLVMDRTQEVLLWFHMEAKNVPTLVV